MCVVLLGQNALSIIISNNTLTLLGKQVNKTSKYSQTTASEKYLIHLIPSYRNVWSLIKVSLNFPADATGRANECYAITDFYRSSSVRKTLERYFMCRGFLRVRKDFKSFSRTLLYLGTSLSRYIFV